MYKTAFGQYTSGNYAILSTNVALVWPYMSVWSEGHAEIPVYLVSTGVRVIDVHISLGYFFYPPVRVVTAFTFTLSYKLDWWWGHFVLYSTTNTHQYPPIVHFILQAQQGKITINLARLCFTVSSLCMFSSCKCLILPRNGLREC